MTEKKRSKEALFRGDSNQEKMTTNKMTWNDMKTNSWKTNKMTTTPFIRYGEISAVEEIPHNTNGYTVRRDTEGIWRTAKELPQKTYRTEKLLTLFVLLLTVAIFAGEHFGIVNRFINSFK